MTTLKLALCPAVAEGPDAAEPVERALASAAEQGAQLALLPELPLNPWSPAFRDARDDDAEAPGGPRHSWFADAARRHGIGVVGGVIQVDADGARRNTALVFDSAGALVHEYAKVHLPHEEGFWEQDHYEAGIEPPTVCRAFDVPFGMQICSDVNRPFGSHLLGSLGAHLVLAPRATEAATWERWELVLRANAMTACAFVATVNRPAPENGVSLGGPSGVFSPGGELIGGTIQEAVVVTIDSAQVDAAHQGYPGYLATPTSLYAKGWQGADT